MAGPLWRPSPERIAAARLSHFMAEAGRRHGVVLKDYDAIYDWSVSKLAPFWELVWDFCGVQGDRRGPTLVDPQKMPGARFFPEAQVNFAENLLSRRGSDDAIVFRAEDKVARRVSWDELHALVSRLAQAMAAEGVGPGDRVAAFMPNMPEAVAAMLATTALGAVWSSCSPDFGVTGVLDRFGQIEPKVLFAPDGYFYAGKTIDVAERVAEFMQGLPTVKRLVTVPLIGRGQPPRGVAGGTSLADFIAPFEAGPVAFRRQAFNAPAFILYSSGTTGKPKCIVHGAGGTLIQHLKEHQLQCDVKAGDRVAAFMPNMPEAVAAML
ncbi:MAG TPA: AMP-binding protein, partial [Kiloniellales bacterium]|nr:AMP-binding protein [Kiloniellales bacterium]